MAKNLVIVESPAKAKPIERYLGKDFKIARNKKQVPNNLQITNQ